MDWVEAAINVAFVFVSFYIGRRVGWNQGARWAAEETSNRIVEEMNRRI